MMEDEIKEAKVEYSDELKKSLNSQFESYKNRAARMISATKIFSMSNSNTRLPSLFIFSKLPWVKGNTHHKILMQQIGGTTGD